MSDPAPPEPTQPPPDPTVTEPGFPADRPLGVWVIGFLLVSLVLCGGWALGMIGTGMVGRPPSDLPLYYLSWSTVLAAVALRPFFLRRQWAWAAVLGLSAGALLFTLGRLALTLAGVRPVLFQAPDVLRVVLEGLIVCLAWGLREWFGIEQRRGAVTLWRLGWWSLLVSGGLALAMLSRAALAA